MFIEPTIDTRQPFARHPALATEIERMAGSGNVGSMIDWDRFLNALNSALSHPGQGDWQPIKTAPKDQPIIGWWNGYKRPCVMWWNLVDKAFESYADRHEDPSLWMPLPRPPLDLADIT